MPQVPTILVAHVVEKDSIRRSESFPGQPPKIRLAKSAEMWLFSGMKKLCLFSAGVVLAMSAYAETISFDFKDPKSVNNVVFRTDALLESINGTATGITGKVDFDPEKPDALKGKIVLDAKTLTVPNPMMQQHLQSPMWLETAKYPN